MEEARNTKRMYWYYAGHEKLEDEPIYTITEPSGEAVARVYAYDAEIGLGNTLPVTYNGRPLFNNIQDAVTASTLNKYQYLTVVMNDGSSMFGYARDLEIIGNGNIYRAVWLDGTIELISVHNTMNIAVTVWQNAEVTDATGRVENSRN